jgi:Ca2+-binding EF-hand superfamily protein
MIRFIMLAAVAALALGPAPAWAWDDRPDAAQEEPYVVDTDRDGRINSWEFEDAYGQDATLEEFTTYDVDGDGAIEPWEVE